MIITKGQQWNVLDHGFVQYIDHMGDDQAVVDAARVSYQKGTKHTSDTRQLLRYMMRKRHTSPFEMCEVKLCVKVPMDAWRQWIRTRTASVNEYSTRYSEAIDERQACGKEWRAQSGTNKQGSDGLISEEWPDDCSATGEMEYASENEEDPVGFLEEREKELHQTASEIYQERLALGVAREVARKDLPLSTYTMAYWKIDLHNLFHFLGLRMDSHAQQEIRSYANVIGEQIVATLFPLSWEAFCDYRLGSVTFSRIEVEAMRSALTRGTINFGFENMNDIHPEWDSKAKCSERDDFLVKLRRIWGQ